MRQAIQILHRCWSIYQLDKTLMINISLSLSKKRTYCNVLTVDQCRIVSRRPLTAKSRLPTQHYKVSLKKEYVVFFRQDTFCQNLKDVLVEKFLVQAEIKNSSIDYTRELIAYTVVLSGSTVHEVSQAFDALELFFTTCFKKKFLDKTIGSIG